ncbi:MAG: leucine-rich repeat domain-containing protein, partial [Clostridia bacterium]|nr:leucine-rich repeat domain-containing protein [Clostridia bacterium]
MKKVLLSLIILFAVALTFSSCIFITSCTHNNPTQIVVVEAKEATCNETGLTEGMKCNLCGTMVVPQVVVPVKECTDLETLPYKAPTCQETGLTDGMQCNICGKLVVEQEIIPQLACVEGAWVVDKEATKAEDGAKHTECTMCGKRVKEEVIYALGSSGLDYTVNSDGESCTITGIGTCTDEDLIIPTYLHGYKVIAIGERAFEKCKTLTSVTISSFVYDIGERAFLDCDSIGSVTFPASLTTIGEDAFSLCDSIKDVYYEGDVEGWCSIDFVDGWSSPMGRDTQLYFGDELVTNLVIPDTVTKIDNHAFFGCGSLASVTIGNGVTVIGDQAFAQCYSLEDIALGNSVKIIGAC